MKRSNSMQALAALIAAALFTHGCITSGRVVEMGNKEAEKVEASMGLMGEKKTVDYVAKIGNKLAAFSELPDGPWTFQVVDTAEPNAFVLPGGHVYVSRGLLALVNSEDELAAAIGHEMGHVTGRHSEKRIRAAVATSPFAIVTGLTGAAASIVAPGLGSMVAGGGQLLTEGLIMAPFSRSQENEADRIGQQLVAKAGYDPSGISTFLHTLDREVKLLPGEEHQPSFLDTHPMAPERVAKTKENARKLVRSDSPPIARDRADVFSRLSGIVVGEDPAQGTFVDQLFLHPELGWAISFPEDWKTINTASVVGALSPAEDAAVALRIVANDAELSTVIEAIKSDQPDVAFEGLMIHGRPAANTLIEGTKQVMDITLIEFGGNVYAVIGQAAGDGTSGYVQSFNVTARSFRALRSSERGKIKESRLRARKANSGESAASISERTGSSWSPEAFAVANGIETDTKLANGQLVKVAIPQPYTSRK